ncbi:ABC transporter ATP-binding protein [Desulfoprunum benzoelyticum]|uniref:Branched-chain amino acid transport system ATP-binding protein n=1 Tax=Desulfoprunum benzoelyticum TaxID=1506996 RepID=A0A840UYF1_9BACT|nr:ABC transporter ATP-binding protein [Desulfoprunum benzoelyticum]MBB5346479.1 branched-chain amino acid transport system ATP-binding protein [Desulfoprunum benzoelyticum]MBM9528992.1 ABC transporter ATP-binding protein [Desulfoprunum benzoelyticum]
MLKLENIQAGYGNILAIKDIDLEINEGEIITLIGANGAGKSTTLMTISGIVPSRSGRILFDDREIQRKEPDEIVRLGICQVPEGRHIFPELTVQENLDMGAFLRRDKKEIKRDIDYVFSLFPILAERRGQDGGTLSGGEQQMLAMSRALMARPRLLLLDEPSMGLAPLVIRQIFEIIKQINAENRTTIFLVEQNANQALHIAHRGYVIENGRIVFSGKAEELLKNTDIQKAYLGI